ncbi:methyl-accepting chemotaxis sensory transducer with TarH sensor [Kosakonia oryzendophytica]|uniref:Methyl-accepting chemotaxis sensory transducer with TarH sensor n=2 Tax=Kosakonia oryzendophytica TaxID=1005665 RepID=A0A1C4AFS0_9ENTR|nr:Methyl-accepting chemotaxis sensory transducer [Enterobacter sp. FY-07]SCB93484.1 methyl-accepting chemotaxis sensory transducer with TarH sensor [Kosakonia oryzendophytica]
MIGVYMEFIHNVKIKFVMLAILIIFTLLWGGVSFFSLHALSGLTEEVALTNVQQVNGDIINNASDRYYQVKLLMDRALVFKTNNDTQNYQQTIDRIGKDIDFLQGGLNQFKVTDHANISNNSTDNIYNSSLTLFNQAIKPMFEAVKADNVDSYTQLSKEQFSPLRSGFSQAIVAYNQEIHDLKAAANDRIASWVSQTRAIIIVAMIIGLAMLVMSERYLALCMARSLEWVKQHLQVLSEGNLDRPTKNLGSNEVGQLIPFLETMQQNWVKTVTQIRNSAGEIYQGASEIASGNTDLSSRTEEQAAALTQTAASMEELSAVVKQNADNASEASTLAKTASAAVNKGEERVQAVIASMKNITESSQKITDIINVIDSIAFQTNILALNAAVEAARAGEQGRGFAVVASEVRNLAQRSAGAAKEIKTLIDESVANVNNGFDQVTLTSESMDNILRSVTSVTDIMGEIATASTEQSKGIGQVGTAISQMDSVTQQNAALVEESSATSSSLEQQAFQLTEIVSVFRLPGDAAQKNVAARPVATKTGKSASRTPATAKSHNQEHEWESF